MTMLHRCPGRRRQQRGVTLTELAIVLAVVVSGTAAVVTGGRELQNRAIRRAEAEMMVQAVENIRLAYRMKPSMTGFSTIEALTYGYLPAVRSNGERSVAWNGWGGQVSFSAVTLNTADDGFQASFGGMSAGECQKFASLFEARAAAIVVGNTSVKAVGGSFNDDRLLNACTEGSTVHLRFFK